MFANGRYRSNDISNFVGLLARQIYPSTSIPLTNIVACATDGAPAMVGGYRGFASLLRQKNPHLFTVHCVIHRQHLVAKRLSPRLQKSLAIAIKAINKIKANAKTADCFDSCATKTM